LANLSPGVIGALGGQQALPVWSTSSTQDWRLERSVNIGATGNRLFDRQAFAGWSRLLPRSHWDVSTHPVIWSTRPLMLHRLNRAWRLARRHIARGLRHLRLSNTIQYGIQLNGHCCDHVRRWRSRWQQQRRSVWWIGHVQRQRLWRVMATTEENEFWPALPAHDVFGANMDLVLHQHAQYATIKDQNPSGLSPLRLLLPAAAALLTPALRNAYNVAFPGRPPFHVGNSPLRPHHRDVSPTGSTTQRAVNADTDLLWCHLYLRVVQRNQL
jgi:hypothetical protein